MKRKTNSLILITGLIVCMLVIQACNLPFGNATSEPELIPPVEPTRESEIFIPLVEGETKTEEPVVEAEETPEVTVEAPTAEPVVHNVTPAEPGWVSKYFYDTDSSTTAASKSAAGGDDYYSNKYERPFSQTDMAYIPDLDIQKAEISSDNNFYYISITLKGLNPTSNSLSGTYGAELDVDLDGRGDYLFYCDVPNFTEWKIDTVHAFKDNNNDVGGKTPTYPDTSAGDGYETLIFSPSMLDDPDGLWCRQRQGSDLKVDLAIHKTLIGSPGQFAWGVWADLGLKQPGLFDYNDHFTFDQAGSAMAGNSYYPLKEIHSVDNTCREAFGFEPTEAISGMCFVPEPTPTTPPTKAPTPTNTLPPRPGGLQGNIFWDTNQDGLKNGVEGYYPYVSKTFRLSIGSCGGIAILARSSTGTSYYWTGLNPGNYCLTVSTMEWVQTDVPMTVTILAGTTIRRDIGVFYIIN